MLDIGLRPNEHKWNKKIIIIIIIIGDEAEKYLARHVSTSLAMFGFT